MNTHKIKKSEWKSWPIAAVATVSCAQIRRDPLTGEAYAWVTSGQRVTIKRFPNMDAEEAN